MIIWILFFIGVGTGSVAFDPNRDPISRWMAFGITIICLLAGIYKWFKGEIHDD